MDALWDLEDKLKLSTRGAILLLACASFAVLSICAVIIMLKLMMACKNNKIVHEESAVHENVTEMKTTTTIRWTESQHCGWISVKRVLMWSRASKLRGSPLLLGVDGSGWQSHNSASAVWQRPILKGEKCELPSFSGLILYDEKGRLLRDSDEIQNNGNQTPIQEKINSTGSKTLKDLLS
ncbi:hypothetical protein HN51_035621 [Arachis hypogaea]|uniref:uncharacterized protein LOC107634306 isoform X2 n=1 Tax=Arachis ipaensis TaxID=130454 RepID=UPI0007AFA90B|nr:uncharacterized protein LOC107634306 isoform X2 [Arachis ipaensis]XP_025643905.1 uncharacterized protein LOC112737949 isoform X2 [Arachis hypogaea]QHO00774.1 uncharacterized protein DS421_13g409270 [Arachis hypogaea]